MEVTLGWGGELLDGGPGAFHIYFLHTRLCLGVDGVYPPPRLSISFQRSIQSGQAQTPGGNTTEVSPRHHRDETLRYERSLQPEH